MKVGVASDLHFEFHPDGGLQFVQELPETNILVVAGDVSNARGVCKALEILLARYKHVVFVFGNHEFYGGSFSGVREEVGLLWARHQGLHVLDNTTCEIEGQRFVGTTLWVPHVPGIERLERYLNDFSQIKDAHQIYEENRRALDFLEETVQADDVVVTHHLPTPESVHPKYQGSPINAFFLCDVEKFIRSRQPKLWVHGHTHESADYWIGRTRVVCNPFGYAGHEVNPGFNKDLVMEVFPDG